MPTGIVKPARELNKRFKQDADGDAVKGSPVRSFHAYVAVRVRPPEPPLKPSAQSLINFPGNASLAFAWQGMQRQFNFDVVFEELASQTEVFDNCGVKDLVKLALEGFNCTCFAYGQTNSGKTYTMTGPPEEMQRMSPLSSLSQSSGLIPRSFAHIFELLLSRGEKFKVYATYFEIYNEQITDLLNPRSIYPHTIRWSATSGFYVDNLFVIECDSAADLMGVLAAGLTNRRTDRGSQNDYSSRSHSLFSIMIDTQVTGEVEGGGPGLVTRHGKLTFVDLAGSESTAEAKEPDQLLETSTINKSLLVLGNCISALSDPKKRQGYVPYRDSKLTKLLSDSLGGNGVSLMIACVNPHPEQGSETMNTLRYASRAKRIEVSPEINLDPQQKLVRSLKQEVASLRQENSSLREKLKAASAAQSEAGGSKSREESAGPESKRTRPVSKGSYQSLYEMLQEYMQENETLRTENLDLAKHQSDSKREQNHLTEENRRLASQLGRLRRQFNQHQQQPQQPQQQQQQRRTPIYVVSNPESRASQHRLPPIEAPQPPTSVPARPAFVTPLGTPKSTQLPPAEYNYYYRSQPGPVYVQHQQLQPHLQLEDRQPHPIPMPPPPLLMQQQQLQQQQLQQQQLQQQQLQQQQLLPVFFMQPAPQLPQQPPPLRLPPTGPAMSPRLVYPGAPVHVPQPGERTYRESFRAAAAAKDRQPGVSESRTVQELAKLNASLRGELRQLDGAIQQHQRVNAIQTDIRRNEGRKILSF